MTIEPQLEEVTESSLDTTSTTNEIVLDTEQELAITLCLDLSKRIVSVTGQAGSGKTTCLKKSFASFIAAGYKVALAAPTGKASKRIQEVTGFDAVTVHRMLKFSRPGEIDEKTGKPFGISAPQYTRSNPLPYDVVFVDEYSMVNQELHRDIIDAMKPGSVLRCFGDINQLKPIEMNKEIALQPSPFQDILTRFPSVVLKQLHRQGEGSDIAVNAHRILYGMCPVRKPNFELVITNDPVNAIKALIVDHPEIDFQSTRNQIITTQNRSWVGVHSLNGMLQPLFHETMAGAIPLPRSKWEEKTPIYVKKGDKILWTNNDYNLNIFNGEQGTILDLYGDGSVEINFGDRIQVVPPVLVYVDKGIEKNYDPRKVIWLSYAITTHKSQGSEYEHIIYVLNRSCYMMLNRANFYTAVTRAKKHVWLVSDASSMMAAASTTKSRI